MTPEIRNDLLKVAAFLVVPVAFGIAIKRGRLHAKELALQSPVSYKQFFIWWFLFLLFVLLSEFALFRAGYLEVRHRTFDVPVSLIRITGIVVLAPVAEELLFRGLLLFKLTQWKLNKHAAIVTQALIFVSLHAFAYENTVTTNIGIAQTFIDACLFAYARFNTQSIFTPMAMHATGNLIAVLEQFMI
jgi:membrane protease YdiL (CAAX protease family)